MESSAMLALTGAAYTYIKDIAGFALNERDRQKFTAIQFDLTEKIIQFLLRLLRRIIQR